MPAPIHLQLARQIVDTLKSICEHDINYIDTQGRICASTDEDRIDDFHEGGAEAARTGEIITIEEDDPEKGVRRGINMPIRLDLAYPIVCNQEGVSRKLRFHFNMGFSFSPLGR